MGIYVLTVAGALAISGVYHAIDRGWALRQMMRQIDHMAIWFLIAGTFTAVHGVACRGFWRKGILAIVWSYALVGVCLQMFWFDAFSGNLGLALYLGMGWIGIASILKLGKQMGYSALAPMFAGGLAFSAGAILEAADIPVIVPKWIGPHEFFHLAVLLGLALHWRFVAALLRRATPALEIVARADSPEAASPESQLRRRSTLPRLRRRRTRGVARYRQRRSFPALARQVRSA